MFDDFTQSYDTLEKSGIENPLFETLRLFDLLAGGAIRKTNLSGSSGSRIDMMDVIQKRRQGVPWEYILGEAHFMGNLFICTPDTLIPTDETRALVNAALQSIREKQAHENDLVLIELGTGCGNIASTLAMHTNHIRILASDISPAAVAVAKRNVDKYKLGDRISLFCGDLFSPFLAMGYKGTIDFVVCNPPYIPTATLNKLSPEIIGHEPRVALDGGPYGIDVFRRLITDSLAMLKPGGMLLFEIGERQEKLASRLIEKNCGYEGISYFEDEGKIRVLRVQKKRMRENDISAETVQ
jgi:release factor glutamine methyltransferase